MNRVELLLPIREDSPSGDMIRYENIYREIQSLRNATDAQVPDYKKLETVCVNTLKNVSKDLHVVVILTEAWANSYGLSGLTEGLHLIIDMCETFWTTLHPNNLDDQDARLSSFVWINDKLSDVVLKTRITAPQVPGMPIYTLATLIDARQLELVMQKSGLRKTDVLDQALKENRPTLEILAKSMIITPIGFYEQLVTDIQSAVVAIERLEGFLDDKYKEESITLKSFDTYLDYIKTYAEEAIEKKRALPPTEHTEPSEDDEQSSENTSTTFQDAKRLPADQLYVLLAKIAERLEEIEPKSPAPKLVRKAIEWGNMSTTELFNDLARHDISIAEITKILG
ncbi:MAG: type VI secretion system protein TssA [Alphaproteobacteria bacterium]|nr:type VI secretion system protein TssA [Alphaproteobacteria bacterium]